MNMSFPKTWFSVAFLAKILLLVFVFHPNPVLSEVPVPELKKRVTDLSGTLKDAEKIELERFLKDFENRKGSQIAVLIVPSTEEEAIEQYSIRVVDEWKIGRKKIDDGVLLLVAKNDRKLRIEVGRGLEGALTDVLSKRIIEEIIKPEFKTRNYFLGVKKGVEAITKVIDGEDLPVPTIQSKRNQKTGTNSGQFPIFFLISFVVLIFIRMYFGFLKGAGIVFIVSFFIYVFFLYFGQIANALIYSSIITSGYLIFFGFVQLFGSSGSNSSSGSSWISSSSSGSSSSFGGGGGSFGGGGASGSW